MTTFDIVIPSRGPEMGLWMTLASCERELQDAPDNWDYKYHIVRNGCSVVDDEETRTIDYLKDTGHLASYTHDDFAAEPGTARNLGAKRGTGEFIFFFDDHVMVEPGYFEEAFYTFNTTAADGVHSVTKFWPGDSPKYHYRFTLERNFWGVQLDTPRHKAEPYRIAAGGHGGWAVRRSVWEELGGYWEGFRGWGGEEMYWELLMGLTDKNNYLDPKMIHWHHPGARPYDRDKSVDFVRNMMMCAHVIGGPKWFSRTADGLSIREMQQFASRGLDFEALRQEAFNASAEKHEWVMSIAKRSLNEQLGHYSRIGAAM